MPEQKAPDAGEERPLETFLGDNGRKPGRLRSLPVRNLIPNGITILALCAGLTAIRFAIEGRFEVAVIAVLVASVLDALDGRIARLLKGSTKFGAELDSLTDFVNFGVAPVVILYVWSLDALKGLGWMVVLGFAICCALRLARFNTALEEPDKPAWAANYFVGVPAPAGAGLVLVPLYLSFIGLDALRHVPVLIAFHVVLIAFLMVSRLPTYSGKRLSLRVQRDWVLPILLLVGLLAASLISFPWITLSLVGAAYLASIPVSVYRYRELAARSATRTEAHSETRADESSHSAG